MISKIISLYKHPLLLRNESFGGILFDTYDGTQIELDDEAFNFISSYTQKKIKLNYSELLFLKKMIKNIKLYPFRIFHKIHIESKINKKYTFPVYQAPTLVDFMITYKCYENCSHCYANAHKKGLDCSIDDIYSVIDQVSFMGVFQMALGGGEPLLHPKIDEIIKYCFTKNIVTNLTTTLPSGSSITQKLPLLKKYCGAIGLSLENINENYQNTRKSSFSTFVEKLSILINSKIPTVIQVTLGQKNFAALEDIVKFCMNYPLYGVLFLAFKPVGRGKNYDRPLSELSHSQVYPKLRSAFLTLSKKMKVGYDVCLTPAIVELDQEFSTQNNGLLEGCSATRTSIGITPELNVVPCTFLPKNVLGNLKTQKLSDIWNNEQTNNFRSKIMSHMNNNMACKQCNRIVDCLGGCPEFNLTNCSLNDLDQDFLYKS